MLEPWNKRGTQLRNPLYCTARLQALAWPGPVPTDWIPIPVPIHALHDCRPDDAASRTPFISDQRRGILFEVKSRWAATTDGCCC